MKIRWIFVYFPDRSKDAAYPTFFSLNFFFSLVYGIWRSIPTRRNKWI